MMKKFISEYSDTITICLIIVAILLTIYFVGWQLEVKEKTFINLFSIIGTMASISGFLIAIIQIVALKEISEITNNTIQSTKTKLILGISISDVSEAIKLINEIDTYLGIQKHEIARLKLIDLREKIMQFKSSEEFNRIFDPKKIGETIIYLNFEISQLKNTIFSDVEVPYDAENITQKLQEISTYFIDFKNKIKYQTI